MKLDDVKKLQQKKYRQQFGCYLVEGEHLILELEKAASSQVALKDTQLYVTEKYQDWAGPFYKTLVSDKQMAQLSDTKSPQGIIARVPLPKQIDAKQGDIKSADPSTASRKLAAGGERSIYLHEVQDPGNLGTILRTLAWFGNFRLLLSPNSVDPFNPKVVRASMGAIFHVPLELDVTLADLENRFESFAYLDMNGSPINTPAFSEYQCYLFGNEARGVPHEALETFKAKAFTIPGNGTIESLNLASAVNMSVYQLSV